MSLLRNKVVAVTGSSQGIGRAIAIACANQGAKLVLHHLGKGTEKDAESLQAQIPGSITYAADLTKDSTGLIEKTVSTHGKLDVLVNNAGICTFAPFQEVTKDLLERHMAVNFTSAFMVSQAAAKHMKDGGSIVSIASITALLGSELLTHYSPTKSAIIGMTVSAAVALGKQGIRFNVVSPGTIETTMNKADLDIGNKRAEMAARVPLRRLGRPEDVAGAVVFFASDLAQYVSGQYLLVDGGASVSYQ